MKLVGVTETYDPCFVSDWDKNLLEANIIITKELTDDMIQKLVQNKDKIILHHTITGYGGTLIEPGVKNPGVEIEQFKKLISAGFPLTHYVLRCDPIIPETEGINLSENVINWFYNNLPYLRCRISMVDLYPHVIERLKQNNITPSWNTFTAPHEYFERVEKMLENYTDKITFEACAERGFSIGVVENIGCVSKVDIKILGLNLEEYGFGASKQRKLCGCLAKKQILGVKPGQCNHKCIYCYWKS